MIERREAPWAWKTLNGQVLGARHETMPEHEDQEKSIRGGEVE